MTKMIAREQIEKVKDSLGTMEKPQKEKFSRKEAVEQLRGTIRTLLAKGWDFADIAAVIRNASDKTMNYRPNDLRKYYEETSPASGVRRRKIKGSGEDNVSHDEEEKG